MQDNQEKNIETTIEFVKPEVIDVNCYTLFEFCLAVQAKIIEGYRFMDTNEGFPRAYVGIYECKMQLAKPEEGEKDARVFTTQIIEKLPTITESSEPVRSTKKPKRG